jgi:hypothetical protein
MHLNPMPAEGPGVVDANPPLFWPSFPASFKFKQVPPFLHIPERQASNRNWQPCPVNP